MGMLVVAQPSLEAAPSICLRKFFSKNQLQQFLIVQFTGQEEKGKKIVGSTFVYSEGLSVFEGLFWKGKSDILY